MANDLYTYKDTDCLLSLSFKNTLNNMHKDFAFVLINKGPKKIALACEIFFAFVIVEKLGLDNNLLRGI